MHKASFPLPRGADTRLHRRFFIDLSGRDPYGSGQVICVMAATTSMSGEMGTLILQSRYAVRGRGRVTGLVAEMSDQLQKLPLAVIADDTTV